LRWNRLARDERSLNMQIPIVHGIYADENSNFRIFYPKNLEPVALNSGISQGYLRPAEGVANFENSTTLNGADRSSINWLDVCFRVMSGSLYKIFDDGSYEEISTVTGSTQCTMDYSFDYLAIAADKKLYLYDGTTLQQNVDADLGDVLDVVYIDGYFMTTDGSYLVITDLGDPFSVGTNKYGSSEVDPDPIVGLLKVHNEIFALNRYTIEAFYNKGTPIFPFARIEGSRVNRGLIGTHAKCEFKGAIAFMGGGRNEPTSIWITSNADTNKIATREIDQILSSYTEEELSKTVFEKRIDKNHEQIWVRLTDQILIYDEKTSQAAQTPIWFIRDTGPKNLCWAYNKWIVGNDDGLVGYLDESISTVWDVSVEWEFQTNIIYNESKGAVVHELELVGLPGRVALGNEPTVWTSYSLDGETWSNERPINIGRIGNRLKRMVWLNQGAFKNYRIQRFRGNSDSHLSIARLEARLEGLEY
jgi:hypothetical protein